MPPLAEQYVLMVALPRARHNRCGSRAWYAWLTALILSGMRGDGPSRLYCPAGLVQLPARIGPAPARPGLPRQPRR